MLLKDSKGHRIRYSQAVDWFSFGCVIYEMIIGFSPFRSERIYEWSGLTKKDKVRTYTQWGCNRHASIHHGMGLSPPALN